MGIYRYITGILRVYYGYIMLRQFLCQGHTDDHRSKTFFSRSPFCSSSLDRSCAMLCPKHLVNIGQKNHVSSFISKIINEYQTSGWWLYTNASKRSQSGSES